MSSQADGAINLPSSYNPNRLSATCYRSKSIEGNGFNSWASNNMYKSTYAHFHSKVLFLAYLRNPQIQELEWFLATKDLSLRTEPKVYMLKDLQVWLKTHWAPRITARHWMDYQQMDLTLAKNTLSISLKLDPQANTVEVHGSELILLGK